MIVNERITAYINSLYAGSGRLCDQIEEEAAAAGIPIIRRETAALLKVLVSLKCPKAILEVGTAVGYSSLVMSGVMPRDCRITTIEKYEKRIPSARKHFREAGQEERINLVCGDADEILGRLTGPYDLIFMDAAKGQYLSWLPAVLPLLSPGGLLISDNVLQDGDIAESRFAVERRNRTIHGRMREYLYELTHREELGTAVLPVGDGVALSVKKQAEEDGAFRSCADTAADKRGRF